MQDYLNAILKTMNDVTPAEERLFCNIVGDVFLVKHTRGNNRTSLYFGKSSAKFEQAAVKAGYLQCEGGVSRSAEHNPAVATAEMHNWLVNVKKGKGKSRAVAVHVGSVAIPANLVAAPMPIAQQPVAQQPVAAATRTITMAELQAFLASKGLVVTA